ncbi:MAG TPA: RidA family protein [Acidimicrobiales bacterium]|nr:RidA family protein [Acidimicrobiales bacterium]
MWLRIVVLLSDTTSAAPPTPPYSPVVRAGDWLICSGQLGLDKGTLVDGDVTGQLTRAIGNLERLLIEQGSSLGAVAKTTVFLVDMNEYAVMNEAYVAAFRGHRPARSAIGVAALPLGALVEIEAWAFAPTA